jgi:hypothetical protein
MGEPNSTEFDFKVISPVFYANNGTSGALLEVVGTNGSTILPIYHLGGVDLSKYIDRVSFIFPDVSGEFNLVYIWDTVRPFYEESKEDTEQIQILNKEIDSWAIANLGHSIFNL